MINKNINIGENKMKLGEFQGVNILLENIDKDFLF